jgi:EAL domain-containing protein (putative c-di-GMP-specific phosphodiesterase class I)
VLRPADTLARLGGDEFVLLLSDIASPEECSLILERVLRSVGTPIDVEGQSVVVSASIGVSLYPLDRVDADTLLRHADQAMYRAKELGKNRFHLFDPASDLKAQLHRQFVERLGVALANKEFCLHYQPKVDLQNGRIEGLEALIRWQHPERGLLGPSEFLTYFYDSNLECQLGAWVIDTALAQAEAWQTQCVSVPVSVNISANHLLSANFMQDVSDALARHPSVAPVRIELEILESTAIDDMATAIAVLEQCKRLGLMLALDDFGTGYSSLTYLRKLPVDTLKIDQSFVRDMLSDSEDFGIVEGVIRLASAFRRQVIAEGVETPEHGAALLGLGCRLAQGYGIARPMPPEQFLDWAADWVARGGLSQDL